MTGIMPKFKRNKEKNKGGRPENGAVKRIEKFKEKYPDVVTVIQSYTSDPLSPAKWKPDYTRQIFWLALAGMTEVEMANIIGIATPTMALWKKNHPDFLAALEAGRAEAVGLGAHALFQVGIGYEHEAVKMFPSRVKEYETDPLTGKRVLAREFTEIITKRYIKKYPPNVLALKTFLAAKYPEIWGDRSEVVHSGTVQHNVDLTKLSKKQLKMLQKVKELGETSEEI